MRLAEIMIGRIADATRPRRHGQQQRQLLLGATEVEKVSTMAQKAEAKARSNPASTSPPDTGTAVLTPIEAYLLNTLAKPR